MRVLFVSHGLELGGAESSLIGYLHALAGKSGVKTDLFLYRHFGEGLRHIPNGVTLLPENAVYACLATPIKSVLKKGHFLTAAGRTVGKLKAKRFNKKHGVDSQKSAVALEYSHKYTKRFMPTITDAEYDLAVSFLTPHYFVLEKVRAKRKVAFIHTDYSYITVDAESETAMWSGYDRIAAVSASVAESFTRLFPALKNKVSVIENVNPVGLIRARAKEFVPTDEMPDGRGLKLLSIGRFCEAKNFESIPAKAAVLKKLGLSFVWYIIGYGDDTAIKSAIAENGVQKEVVILGKKENPYPYIKRCDIYAQPSRYEGKAVTVLEAQILAKPVIISDYATARSQLQDGTDGLIAPMDDESFAKMLYALACDEQLRARLSAACEGSSYGNEEMADKLLEV